MVNKVVPTGEEEAQAQAWAKIPPISASRRARVKGIQLGHIEQEPC